MLDLLQYYFRVLCNGMKTRFRMVMIAHPGPGIGFHKRFMWRIIIPPTTSPPIDHGENQPPAVAHVEKCAALREHLFPEPPPVTNEPPVNLHPQNGDLEYMSVTKREVRDAIFMATQLNAPGISGLTGRAWRWAWGPLEEEIYHLIRLCMDSGYHPDRKSTRLNSSHQII